MSVPTPPPNASPYPSNPYPSNPYPSNPYPSESSSPNPWDPSLTTPSAYRPPAPRELPLSKAALASMVLGLISAVPLSLIFGFVGLGATANGTRSGRGFAWAGLAVSMVWIVGIAGFVVWGQARQPDRDGSGQVSAAGVSDVFDLQTGDCLRDPGTSGEVTEASVVPCDQAHLGQVVASVYLSAGDGSFDATRVQTESEQLCQDATTSALTADAPADLRLFTLSPVETSWETLGDRTTLCIVIASTPLTTSIVS